MKFLASLAVLATGLSSLVTAAPTISYFQGFNLPANAADRSCKTTAQWQTEFTKLKSWSPKFNVVKLFSTSDCSALKNAVPAAKAAGIKIWAGVWAVDNNKFNADKAALEAAIKLHGTSWLAGINVGSESLYRKEIDPNLLAQHIYDVKGMVQIAYHATNVPVGCADTWTAWVDGANRPVITASDIILMNGFPYWEGVYIDNALAAFKTSIAKTKAAIGTKPMMIGETGWPTAGPKFGLAVANTANLQKYWTATACWLQKSGTMSWFWFEAFNEPKKGTTIEQNFGVASSNMGRKINLTCP